MLGALFIEWRRVVRYYKHTGRSRPLVSRPVLVARATASCRGAQTGGLRHRTGPGRARHWSRSVVVVVVVCQNGAIVIRIVHFSYCKISELGFGVYIDIRSARTADARRTPRHTDTLRYKSAVTRPVRCAAPLSNITDCYKQRPLICLRHGTAAWLCTTQTHADPRKSTARHVKIVGRAERHGV